MHARSTSPASEPATDDCLARVGVGYDVDDTYRLVSEIARGGMGVLYESRHLWTRQEVVVKVLHPHLRGERSVEERFLREAQALARLDHPNVVRVIDTGRDHRTGALYLVEERLRGEDLATLLHRAGPLSVTDALELVAPVMSALTRFHQVGIVHRDVNPANIFLARGRNGSVVPTLIDLGIAHVIDDSYDDDAVTWVYPPGEILRPNAPLTLPGVIFGTPPYMAPEQIDGSGRIDARTDVWAVGATLYEALSGQAPFGAGGSPIALYRRICCESPRRLDAVTRGVPRALADQVHRALSRDPADRHASMQHFIDALLDAAGRASQQRCHTSLPLAHPGGAVAPPVVHLVPVTLPAAGPLESVAPAPASLPPVARAPRRLRTAVALAVAALLATALLALAAVPEPSPRLTASLPVSADDPAAAQWSAPQGATAP